MTSHRSPPRAPLGLAERLVDARMRDAVLGDLVEAWGDGSQHGALWFWRQSLLAIAHFPPRPRFQPDGDGHMMGFVYDISRAARTLRRAPAFTIACAVTLGIGIGAATAIFSVADPVMLRPLPYPEPERLFAAWENDDRGQRSNVGWTTVMDVRAASRSFEQVSAIGGWSPTIIREGAAEQLSGLRVSPNYFTTIGVRPAIGRNVMPEEDNQARNGVVIVSHAFWRSRLGGDTAALTRTLDIGGRARTLAGVMPADYDDIMPRQATATTSRTDARTTGVAPTTKCVAPGQCSGTARISWMMAAVALCATHWP